MIVIAVEQDYKSKLQLLHYSYISMGGKTVFHRSSTTAKFKPEFKRIRDEG